MNMANDVITIQMFNLPGLFGFEDESIEDYVDRLIAMSIIAASDDKVKIFKDE